MILTAVLTALALDRMLIWHRDIGIDRFWCRLVAVAAARLPGRWSGTGGVLLLVVGPVVVVGLIQWFIAGWLFGLVDLLFAIAVLVLAIGPLDVLTVVDDYIEARRADDPERSDFHYQRLVGSEVPAEGGTKEARGATEAVLHQGHDHVFAVVFWFCVLGPLGAVLYRLVAEAALRPGRVIPERPALAASARDVLGLLGWIPARLLALGYAMTGSFDSTLVALRRAGWGAGDWLANNRRLLLATGLAALRLEPADENDEAGAERRTDDAAAAVADARGLVIRACVFWLAVLALLTLAGWFG